MDIGVDMEINAMDEMTGKDYVSSGKHDGLCSLFSQTGGMLSPWMAISVLRTGDRQNTTFNNDATFDGLYDKIKTSTTVDEVKQLVSEADMYAIEQCWEIFMFQGTNPVLMQPYLKGYNGEYVDSGINYSRFWIDQELKTSMGR
jgi:ABC-type transport system substrate-binding protein